MNLIIDIGNTRVKLAVYENNSKSTLEHIAREDFFDAIKELLEKFPKITNSIVSSVAFFSEKEQKQLQELLPTIFVQSTMVLPFYNTYSTPKTLGADRIALVSAAALHYKNQNVLIIDAGTCVTYDLINDNNEYLGGAISPGLTIRYESLHNLTATLPLLKPINQDVFIGNTTESSIHAGIINGLKLEIDGVIQQYQSRYNNLTIILTGGDANFLAKRLKSSIFAKPNFLLDGLHHLLKINTN